MLMAILKSANASTWDKTQRNINKTYIFVGSGFFRGLVRSFLTYTIHCTRSYGLSALASESHRQNRIPLCRCVYMCHTAKFNALYPFLFVNFTLTQISRRLYLMLKWAGLLSYWCTRCLYIVYIYRSSLITSTKDEVCSCVVVFVICFFVVACVVSSKYETIMANVSNESLISYLMFIHLVSRSLPLSSRSCTRVQIRVAFYLFSLPMLVPFPLATWRTKT